MNKNSRKIQPEKVENSNVTKHKEHKKRKKWQYPLITILLLFFLLQLVRGIVGNTVKLISFRTKIIQLEKINKVAERKNQYLREEVEKYTSNSGIEALARNRLQFSKDDETLVIIKNTDNDATEN